MTYRVSAGLKYEQVEEASKLPFSTITKTTLVADGMSEAQCVSLLDGIHEKFGSILNLRWINISH